MERVTIPLRRLRRTSAPETPSLVFTLQPARVSLSIASTPSPAFVFIDDREAGSTPLADLLLDLLEVRRQGFQPFRVELQASPGESLHYTAHLKPVAVAKAAAKPKAEAEPVVPVVAELGDTGVTAPQKRSGEFARYPEADPLLHRKEPLSRDRDFVLPRRDLPYGDGVVPTSTPSS